MKTCVLGLRDAQVLADGDTCATASCALNITQMAINPAFQSSAESFSDHLLCAALLRIFQSLHQSRQAHFAGEDTELIRGPTALYLMSSPAMPALGPLPSPAPLDRTCGVLSHPR